MKKEEHLARELTDMIQQTEKGKIYWDVLCQTTEYNDADTKPVEVEDSEQWVVDECFVSYHCTYHEEEFLLISYEQIYTCGEKKKSMNLLFLPPLGMRFFDIDMLAPYAVEADRMLVYEVHTLWTTLLEMYKKDPESVKIEVSPRELVLN
ncbi:MAG: hypothetical protein PUF81_06320 [Lachnospiraceae bacterium]|nr:hypothetical protein [Agathobacter sp.]MDD6445446.1 hypothetical protein [Lachnospiraceae bacterium]MDY4894130.1 hypothetical protein [Agathobacter sp.]